MSERILAAVRPEAGAAVVHVEDRFDTSVDDLWAAVTDPDRLARWLGEVTGDLREGGVVGLRFTSRWTGTGRIVVCDPPRRLLVTTREEDGQETEMEALVTADGDGARLVVEERGFPVEVAPDHAAGWQVHLEDLGAVLAGRERGDWLARWQELIPAYRPEG